MGLWRDGQMLPRQTKRTETGLGEDSVILRDLCNIEMLWLLVVGIGDFRWQNSSRYCQEMRSTGTNKWMGTKYCRDYTQAGRWLALFACRLQSDVSHQSPCPVLIEQVHG
jgi:hypothetical protein